jgi:CBS domain containing-hemolysin-like protein
MDLFGIIATIVLLVANFFFVGAEFSLIAARRSVVEPKALEGGRPARMTLWAIENVSLMMAGAQLGITVCSLALGWVTKPMVQYAIEGPLQSWGVPAAMISVISYAVALAVVTYLHVVLGEMVPKNIALAGPERMALVLGPVLVVVVRVLQPVLWLMNATGNGILRMFGVQPKNEVTSTFTRDEVAGLVEESREGGLLDRRDEQLLLGALTFESRDISSVVIPIGRVRVLPETTTPAQVEEAAVEGFSRYPLRAETGALTGYVHIKDVIAMPEPQRSLPLERGTVRELPVFALDESVGPALRLMQREGAHLALVRDAGTGEIAGLVTLEDMLEELVGQIRDDSRTAAV